MTKNPITDPGMDKRLQAELNAFKTVPPRNPDRAAAGRSAFLLQAEEISRKAVSPTANVRHMGWISNLISLFKTRKERSPMSIFVNIFLAVSMLLGTGGLTVAAAQGSMPNDFLYPVKIWSEDVRLDLTADPQARVALELEFTERRIAEIQTMVQAGEVPPEAVQTRLQTHLQTALNTALGQANEQALQDCIQIRDRLQTQLQIMDQLHTNQPENASAQQIRQMLQEQIRLAELGLEDPAMLRLQLQDQERTQNTTGSDVTPGPQETAPGNPEITPGESNGPGPQETAPVQQGTGTPSNPDNGNGQQQPPTPDDTQGYGPGPQTPPDQGGNHP